VACGADSEHSSWASLGAKQQEERSPSTASKGRPTSKTGSSSAESSATGSEACGTAGQDE